MDHGWREFRAWLRETTNVDTLREAVDVVLIALGDRSISPHSAGRLLQAIEDRRRELGRSISCKPK